jgi:DNA-binding NarL/FixJ family response regulator
VASDDPLARGGLTTLVAALPGVEVATSVAWTDDWPAAVREHDPDLIVADLGPGTGPDAEGLQALGQAGAPVLALVADETRARAALRAGARGVLGRDADAARLLAGLEAVARGLVALDDLAFEALRPRTPAPLPTAETLTPRETEVLQLLSEGLSNRQIGDRLGIGERTAKFHVNSILAKLGAESRTEAVVLAARLGLVTL